MAANQKLTAVLQGRTVVQVNQIRPSEPAPPGVAGATAVYFDDGSVMTVQGTVFGAGRGEQAGRVRGVRQQGTTLELDFENGATLTLRTAEPTSSVIVRARDGSLEYAD